MSNSLHGFKNLGGPKIEWVDNDSKTSLQAASLAVINNVLWMFLSDCKGVMCTIKCLYLQQNKWYQKGWIKDQYGRQLIGYDPLYYVINGKPYMFYAKLVNGRPNNG